MGDGGQRRARHRFGSGANAGEDELGAAIGFAEEAQGRGLDALADRPEADLRGAGRCRGQKAPGAVLVEQLEAADGATGDDGDEDAAGQVAGIGHRDLTGRPGGADRRRAEIGRIGGWGEDRPPAAAGQAGGEGVESTLARTCAVYSIVSRGLKYTCT